VAGHVRDRHTHDLGRERDEVEEIAAHRLHRLVAPGEIEAPVLGEAPRQDRRLDLARLAQHVVHALAHDLLVDRVAQDGE
jgi:hypothetical protein